MARHVLAGRAGSTIAPLDGGSGYRCGHPRPGPGRFLLGHRRSGACRSRPDEECRPLLAAASEVRRCADEASELMPPLGFACVAWPKPACFTADVRRVG